MSASVGISKKQLWVHPNGAPREIPETSLGCTQDEYATSAHLGVIDFFFSSFAF
ncbi:hypothetical protein CROQUDRAFT_654068 [Cronartium quercuum f. sp. fusiforme G11]|uniref:Uncharacterized protein n=1 Tax=Cronartium quercuum f. sp. fusiforme G11 TaxID=708437 RepID=A0A9P6NN69_9BASI|nr:hypothetical protein CROQUDRAFT_654068 [Cronartium quercuum f. sp. fusiforme G11]